MTDTLEIPPFVRNEMRKAMAFGRLREAAQAMLDEETAVAHSSYATPGQKLTNAEWRKMDETHFNLCRELRNALREAARCFPDHSASDALANPSA